MLLHRLQCLRNTRFLKIQLNLTLSPHSYSWQEIQSLYLTVVLPFPWSSPRSQEQRYPTLLPSSTSPLRKMSQYHSRERMFFQQLLLWALPMPWGKGKAQDTFLKEEWGGLSSYKQTFKLIITINHCATPSNILCVFLFHLVFTEQSSKPLPGLLNPPSSRFCVLF